MKKTRIGRYSDKKAEDAMMQDPGTRSDGLVLASQAEVSKPFKEISRV
jgi:hypothetical protein